MKAVILAGGNGTRLHPITKSISKQLLPIGGKPMIYYPLSVAMLSGVKDVAIITQEKNIPSFQQLFGNGENLGINIEYIVQNTPDGLASGLHLAKDFVSDSNFIFLLGDNIIYGHDLPSKINQSLENSKTTMFSYYVDKPNDFGVLVNEGDKVTNFQEKPKAPKSNWASIGLYTFTPKIFDYFKLMSPSARGEYELPDLVMHFMKDNIVNIEKLGRGFVWYDTGTFTNLSKADSFINITESSTGMKISCIEEIAFNNNWIDDSVLTNIENKGEYNEYVWGVINAKKR